MVRAELVLVRVRGESRAQGERRELVRVRGESRAQGERRELVRVRGESRAQCVFPENV